VDLSPLERFAEQVGPDGAVTVVGGRTQWEVGGAVAPGTRELRAPAGIVELEPAEMTVRVGAGTTVADLDAALAEVGQRVVLGGAPGATVGGVLAVGHSDVRRLARGPIRDVLLEARVVSAEGRLVKAGGPTVKNVSGFDLCRLLVGSLGTLALIGQVVLRTWPRPEASRWLAGTTDPFTLRERLARPAAVLWDGTTTWLLLEGHGVDVDAESRVAVDLGLTEVASAPILPPYRWSVPPTELSRRSVDEGYGDCFVAEIGVGTVHASRPQPPRPVAPGVQALTERMRAGFDPTGRLNPGREVLGR